MNITCYTCEHQDRKTLHCKELVVFITGGSYCGKWKSAQICETCKHFYTAENGIPCCDMPDALTAPVELDKPSCWEAE